MMMTKTSKIEPYLFFNGRCEEALAFYESALGAKRVMLMRFKESPEAPPPGMIPDKFGVGWMITVPEK
jgi:uncharacterized glyoxalase superfamily protein PhnB